MSVYGVVGGTLWGNRGAEAMVVTTIGQVRRRDPEAGFLILSYQAARDRQLLRASEHDVVDAGPVRMLLTHLPAAMLVALVRVIGVRWPDILLPRDLKRVRRCRALFDVTGISFHDGRLSVVAYNLVCLWPAILLGVPVIRLSQAMGPFRRWPNRLSARYVGRRAMHSFARGRATAEYIADLGLPKDRWSVAPDVAFCYRPEFSLTAENEDRVAQVRDRLLSRRTAGRELVAVVPSSLVMKTMQAEGRDYVALLERLVRELAARGYHVVVVPNATSEGTDTLRNNDIVPIRHLRSRLDESSEPLGSEDVSYVDFDLNTAAIRSLLEPCEVVVTSRFHAMVAALALGVPTLVLGWSHKYEEVLETFRCEGDAIDFRDVDDDLSGLLHRVLAEREDRRRRIAEALPKVTAEAEAQFDLVDRLAPVAA